MDRVAGALIHPTVGRARPCAPAEIFRVDVLPAVNQVEVHPYYTQPALREAHARLGITTQTWSPLGA